MKKRLSIFLLMALAIIMAAPMAVFAAAPPPEAAIGGTLSVEYRFNAGQTPNIPDTIVQFGFTYHLVSQSDPVLIDTLPAERTYTYRIEGAMTDEELKSFVGLGEVKMTPIEVATENQVDKQVTMRMPTNDVEEIPLFREFEVKSAFTGTGTAMKMLERTGVTFEVIDGYDEWGLPLGYRATVVYRGIESEEVVGYYMVEMTYTTEEGEETDVYVIVAEYQTDEMPPPIDIIDNETPLGPGEGPTSGLTPGDVDRLSLQTGNPFIDLLNGNVPLGGFGVTNAWSFASLILAAVAVATAGVFAIGFLTRTKRVKTLQALGSYDEERLVVMKKRGQILRTLTIIGGAITLVTWLYLDVFDFGMVWINAFTPLVCGLLGVTILLSAVTNARNKKVLSDDEDTVDPGYATA